MADRRVFRLSQEIGLGGVRLRKPAPFEPGGPVRVRFALPGDSQALELEAEVAASGDPEEQEGERGGLVLTFRDLPPEVRAAIAAYVANRLGLPPLPPPP